MPKVTVLMPTYNMEEYVHEAVESILRQDYRDFELLVMDDGSTDRTVEVVKGFDDSRIRLMVNDRNLGLAENLNRGLDHIATEYVARMDGDDLSLPQRLAVQVAYMEAHRDIDLCSCAMQLFGERDEVWVREGDPEKVKVTALFFSPVLHASSLWRRDAFESKGLRYRQEYVPAEDYDLWCRALAAGLRLTNLPDVLYRYRIRAGQPTLLRNGQEARVRREYRRRTLLKPGYYNPWLLARRVVKRVWWRT